jgi:hypothetical protein
MFAPLAHFSFSQVTDPAGHGAENELEELFHRPQLLNQPGVAWRERWALEPACATRAVPSKELNFNYCTMHWLRPPVRASVESFTAHFARTSALGIQSRAVTALSEFMTPLKGYVRREPLVSEQALPFRPNVGAYLIVSSFFRHHDADSEDVFRWYDQVRIPDLLDCPGAAGAWTFATRNLFSPLRDLSQPALRLVLFYLDGDPAAFSDALNAREREWRKSGRLRDTSHVDKLLFAGPVRTVLPWRWGWFDKEATPAVRA